MNEQPIDQRILRYLDEEMPPDEMTQFETEIRTNSDLKEAFSAEVLMRYTLQQMKKEEESLQKQISKGGEEAKQIRPLWQKPSFLLGIAAAIVLLVIFLPPLLEDKSNLDDLIAEYDNFAPRHTYSNTMGKGDQRDSLIKAVYHLFDIAPPYESAIQGLQELYNLEPDNTSHRFYLAFCYFKENQYDQAIQLLENWPEGAKYQDRADYVLVGAILKRNPEVQPDDITQATLILNKMANDSEHDFQKRAQDILKALSLR